MRKPEKPIAAGEMRTVMLRPEGVRVSDKGIIPCKVVLSCFMGSYQLYHVNTDDGLVKIHDNHPVGRRAFEAGEDAFLDFEPIDTHLM